MHEAEVPVAVTALFTALLVAMILSLALEEKLHAKKSLITGVYAVIALLLGAALNILPVGDVVLPGGHAVSMPIYVPAVDWQVIAIILGASLFIDVVSRSGIFTWTAIRLTRLSGGDPRQLLIFYAALTVIFSAVLNNVAAMIIVGSLTGVSLGKLDRKELMLGFLLTEGLLTNVGGLLTLISSVPNIILGNLAGIDFVRFVVVAGPYVLASSAMTLVMAVWMFKIPKLETPAEKRAAAALVDSFDERDGIESQAFFNLSWGLLAAFILTIATTSWIPGLRDLGMGFVAMAYATFALIKYKSEVDESYAALDWDLLFFFIFLFVVVNVAEHAMVLDLLGQGIGKLIALGDVSGGGLLLWSAALASSVTDNVPLAAVMGKILQSSGLESSSHLWWCTIFGTNLGGNFTPIGSASTVVAVAIIHKYRIKLSFLDFVKRSAPFAVAQLTLALLYVMLVLR